MRLLTGVREKNENPKSKPKIKRCPNCNYRMRRIYVKQGYRKKEGKIFKRTKHKTHWRKIGWWCPLCDYIEIHPEI
jgi:uncharacterized protein with PIN domain